MTQMFTFYYFKQSGILKKTYKIIPLTHKTTSSLRISDFMIHKTLFS